MAETDVDTPQRIVSDPTVSDTTGTIDHQSKYAVWIGATVFFFAAIGVGVVTLVLLGNSREVPRRPVSPIVQKRTSVAERSEVIPNVTESDGKNVKPDIVSKSPPSLTPSPVPTIEIMESTTDNLGYAAKSKKASTVMAAGSYVLNLTSPKTYAVVWMPKSKINKVLVLLPGTNGTPYDGLGDELAEAQKFGYGLVGLQWHNKETDTYMEPADVYTCLHAVLQYLRTNKNLSAEKFILQGFSRGSAISYEVTYLDQIGSNWFTATAALSGGVPVDSKLEVKSGKGADGFFLKLNTDKVSTSAYTNHHWFMYCGMEDEEWGTTMCDQISNAEMLVKKYGGIVDVIIKDPTGKHMGFRTNADTRKKYIDWIVAQ